MDDKTGDVAKRLGLNIETLRYYERIGLVASPSRTHGGHRTYSDDDVKRLAFIKRSRELGFSLKDIRELMELSSAASFSCEKIQHITAARLRSIRDKISVLQDAERTLATALEQCPITAPTCCPVLDTIAHDAAAAGGRNDTPHAGG